MADFYCKLKCGDRELNLCDWSLTYPSKEPLEDLGSTVMVSIYVKADKGANARVMRLLHDLHWFSQRAEEYESEHVKEPVYLGMKLSDGNAYDALFGRGWLWKMLTGGHAPEERGMIYELGTDVIDTLPGIGVVNELRITFRIKERKGLHGERIFAWETQEDRWIGQAQGAIRMLDDGGLWIEEATTNKIPNSDFENEADTDNGWTVSNATLTATENTVDRYIWNGFFSYLLEEDGTAIRQFQVSINVGNTNNHSLQCWVKRKDGAAVTAADCVLYYNGVLATTFESMGDGWYRAYSEAFAGVNGAVNCGIEVKLGKEVFVDSFQLEEMAYCTSLAYGNMGRGYTFSGAAHTTSSVRAAAGINYRNAEGTAPQMMPRNEGTMLFIVEAPHAHDGFAINAYLIYSGSTYVHYDAGNTRFGFTDGANTANTGAVTFAKGAVLYVFAQYGPSGLGTYVYNEAGLLLGSGTVAAYAAAAPNAAVWLGADTAPSNQWGKILECQIWEEELTAPERAARVRKGRGSAEMPYLWSHSGDAELYNQDYGVYHNWVEVGNVPGDHDAGAKILIEQYTAGQTPQYLYLGQMRRAVPRSDIPSKKHLVGNHADMFLEIEDGVASYDGDTTDQNPGGESGTAAARTIPSTTTNVLRVKIPVCNEPECLWQYVGDWRIIERFSTNNNNQFKVQYRVVTGKHAGVVTPQFTALADNVWRPGRVEKQILSVPSHYIDPAEIQKFRPGDWAVGVDGVYCYVELWIESDAAAGQIYSDCILLLPNDNEGYARIPTTSDWPHEMIFVADSCSRERNSAFVEDIDRERFFSGCDFSGRFTWPVHEPCKMEFMWQRSGTGYPWTIADQVKVNAKYRPRYERLR